MKSLSFILLAIALLLGTRSLPAHALEIKSAKAAGLVGEQSDGYLGAVSGRPSPEVQALVKEINEKRKAAYQDVASKTKQDLGTVEKIAADKAMNMTPAGQYVNDGSGWKKK
jgi:uncharacterized protein